MGSDPPDDLLDGRSFELPVSRAILEGGVPSRRKKRSGLEVGQAQNVSYTVFPIPLFHKYISFVAVFLLHKHVISIYTHTLTES